MFTTNSEREQWSPTGKKRDCYIPSELKNFTIPCNQRKAVGFHEFPKLSRHFYFLQLKISNLNISRWSPAKLNCFSIQMYIYNLVKYKLKKLFAFNKFPLPCSFQLDRSTTSLRRDFDMQLKFSHQNPNRGKQTT